MKNICFLLLMALLCAFPAAGQAHKANGPRSKAAVPTVPPYCSPCLFYSGDFDPNNPKSGVLANGATLTGGVGASVIYVPFVVPSGQTWSVKGLFVNELLSVEILDPANARWSISTGVSTGNAGTTVASGLGTATLAPTGRSWNGLAEFTVTAQVKEFQLEPGEYWLSLLPQCSNKEDASCSQAEYFASDVEDNPPQNFKGSSPADASFWTYAHGGDYYRQAWGASGACGGGCDRYSAGVIGVAKRNSE